MAKTTKKLKAVDTPLDDATLKLLGFKYHFEPETVEDRTLYPERKYWELTIGSLSFCYKTRPTLKELIEDTYRRGKEDQQEEIRDTFKKVLGLEDEDN